jgi:hypothetical protein
MTAIGLVFILEGILPFAVPDFWRKMIGIISQQNNRSLRFTGLFCMLVGLVIVFLTHIFI